MLAPQPRADILFAETPNPRVFTAGICVSGNLPATAEADVRNETRKCSTDLQAVLLHRPPKWVHNLPANEDA